MGLKFKITISAILLLGMAIFFTLRMSNTGDVIFVFSMFNLLGPLFIVHTASELRVGSTALRAFAVPIEVSVVFILEFIFWLYVNFSLVMIDPIVRASYRSNASYLYNGIAVGDKIGFIILDNLPTLLVAFLTILVCKTIDRVIRAQVSMESKFFTNRSLHAGAVVTLCLIFVGLQALILTFRFCFNSCY